MNNNDFFNFLVATDQVDEFLGYKLPEEIKEELNKLAEDYNNDLINDDEVQDVLMGIELSKQINYEVLYKYFKEQLGITPTLRDRLRKLYLK